MEDSDEEDVPELAPLAIYCWCEHLLDLNDFELKNIIQFVPEIAHVMWTCRRLRALVHAEMDVMQMIQIDPSRRRPQASRTTSTTSTFPVACRRSRARARSACERATEDNVAAARRRPHTNRGGGV